MLSRTLPRPLWRGSRWISAHYPTVRELCGPVALLAVIASWVVLLAVGWSLVLWPHLIEGFSFDPELTPSTRGGFTDALYLSLVTLTTLGFGDIAPASGWLRVLVPLEAAIGLVLLTASLSWVVSLYPAFSRHRSLVHFPISYYFRSSHERFELPSVMPCLLHLAKEGTSEDCSSGVRMRANMLRSAIDDFSATVGARFLDLPSAPTERVLTAYARDTSMPRPS